LTKNDDTAAQPVGPAVEQTPEESLLESYASEPEPDYTEDTIDLDESKARERAAIADLELDAAKVEAEDETGMAHSEEAADLQRLRDAEASLHDGSVEEFLEQTETNLLQEAEELAQPNEADRNLVRELQDTSLLQEGGVDSMLDEEIQEAVEVDVQESEDDDLGKELPAEVQAHMTSESEDVQALFAATESDIAEAKLDDVVATPDIKATVADEVEWDQTTADVQTSEDNDSLAEGEDEADEQMMAPESEDLQALFASTEADVAEDKLDNVVATPDVTATVADEVEWDQINQE